MLHFLDSESLLSLTAILLLILCSAFFSAAETALTAISKSRIYALVMEGNKRAKKVSKLREEKESLIGAVLIGNNGVNILSSALATSLAIKLFGENGVIYATVAMTVLVVVFAEVMPKTYAIQNAEKVSLLFSPALAFAVRLLSPITSAINWFIGRLYALFGIKAENDHFMSITDVLRGTIEMHHRQGSMEKHDRDMLGGVLELEDISVEEIMVHRKQIDAIDLEKDPAEIIEHAIASPHSRLLVYRGDFDQIVGVLHVKNLVRQLSQNGFSGITKREILRICSKPWFIPSTTSLKDQLYAFRQKRQHFALVVDEYGSLLGVVTLEDVIEEIVGEIDDEYDTIDLTNIIELNENCWLVDGDVGIRDLNRYLDWNLPDDEATTIAGLVLHVARDIPDVGQPIHRQ